MFKQEVVYGPDSVSDPTNSSNANPNLVLEFQKCKAQIGNKLGCIPLTPMYVCKGHPKSWDQIPDVLTAHKLIENTGIPNFGGGVF